MLLPQNVSNTNNAYYDLNLDGDSLGIIDYRFIQYVDTSIFNVSGNFIQSRGTAGNSVMGLDYGNYAYPFNLSPGDSIGPGKPFRGSGGSNSVGQLSLEISDTGFKFSDKISRHNCGHCPNRSRQVCKLKVRPQFARRPWYSRRYIG